MRNVYFAFHYKDIFRVNNVRLCGEFKTEKTQGNKSIEGFYDYSQWEAKKTIGESNLKELIRSGVQRTSAICVLSGSLTWERPWVKYEIARAVIDKRGLLTVHINSLPHHQGSGGEPWGSNPLDYIGVGKVRRVGDDIAKYYLYEKHNGSWKLYEKHKDSIELPAYISDPQVGYVKALSSGAKQYDFVRDKGPQNIGGWIDQAAVAVGR